MLPLYRPPRLERRHADVQGRCSCSTQPHCRDSSLTELPDLDLTVWTGLISRHRYSWLVDPVFNGEFRNALEVPHIAGHEDQSSR